MEYVSLSWQEFLEESKEFLSLANSFGDHWELCKKNESEGNAFLKHKTTLQIKFKNTKLTTEDSLEDTTVPMEDKSTVTDVSKTEVFLMEYHILYSISYQVPMLYLKIQQSDGRIVELEDVWHIFGTSDETNTTKARNEMLEILTQMEHPVLFKPYYAIHPCKTAELLAQTPESGNRILTFISLMGPYVKLKLDNRYGLIKRK